MHCQLSASATYYMSFNMHILCLHVPVYFFSFACLLQSIYLSDLSFLEAILFRLGTSSVHIYHLPTHI